MSPSGSMLTDSIGKKIDWAVSCHRSLRDVLMAEPEVRTLLGTLSDAVRASREAQAASGVGDVCRRCAERDGGSCCGAGIEDRYDGWLLLINLLLGRRLPQARQDPSSCFFLGRHGCVLMARHVICINYHCERISARVDSRAVGLLREKEGDEVLALFRLNELVKKVVRAR